MTQIDLLRQVRDNRTLTDEQQDAVTAALNVVSNAHFMLGQHGIPMAAALMTERESQPFMVKGPSIDEMVSLVDGLRDMHHNEVPHA